MLHFAVVHSSVCCITTLDFSPIFWSSHCHWLMTLVFHVMMTMMMIIMMTIIMINEKKKSWGESWRSKIPITLKHQQDPCSSKNKSWMKCWAVNEMMILHWRGDQQLWWWLSFDSWVPTLALLQLQQGPARPSFQPDAWCQCPQNPEWQSAEPLMAPHSYDHLITQLLGSHAQNKKKSAWKPPCDVVQPSLDLNPETVRLIFIFI